MSRSYIEQHFDDIKKYADTIELRLDDSYCTMASVLADNAHYLEMCRKHGLDYILIDGRYRINIDL